MVKGQTKIVSSWSLLSTVGCFVMVNDGGGGGAPVLLLATLRLMLPDNRKSLSTSCLELRFCVRLCSSTANISCSAAFVCVLRRWLRRNVTEPSRSCAIRASIPGRNQKKGGYNIYIYLIKNMFKYRSTSIDIQDTTQATSTLKNRSSLLALNIYSSPSNNSLDHPLSLNWCVLFVNAKRARPLYLVVYRPAQHTKVLAQRVSLRWIFSGESLRCRHTLTTPKPSTHSPPAPISS